MSLWHKKLAIILPTFNESKNLRILLTRIFKATPDVHIFIVDDSNLRENKKILKIAQSFKNVEVFTREKKLGRGSAVLYGFEKALKNKKFEYFVEMDTDLAHDPSELPLLHKALTTNEAQLVIGSRYIENSKIVNWPLRRLLLSKIINLLLNFWLGLRLHDYTNGYRMYQRRAVEYLVKKGLHERGFIALSEGGFLLKKYGLKIIEVPIIFTDRKHGESSVGVRELWMSLVGAIRIKLRYNWEVNNKKSWFFLSKKQACILIIFIALFLRLWNLNAMGKTWDEPAYVEQGYTMVEAIRNGDFDNKQLYHSDHPPLARYLYGVAEHLQIGSGHKLAEAFPYDYTYPRLVSVLFSILSVLLVFFLGWKYISPFVGFTSAMILAMLPFFLGFSQLATLESLTMFFFTASIFSFFHVLQKSSKKWIVLTGLFAGFALLVKQSNALIFPLLGTLYLSWFLYNKKLKLPWRQKMIPALAKMIWVLIPIVLVSVITFFALWPFIIFHIQEVLYIQDTMWVKNVSLPPPEVFFGKLMLVPIPYYFVFFLLTTPIIILGLFFLGLLRIDRTKKWFLFALIIWFLFSFLQSLYPFKQHGIRYIIQIYAPMALIAAIGFETLIYSITTKKLFKVLFVFAFFSYMMIILYKSTPYYLDYFNGIVGGTNGVYEKRMFQLGWWGQGLKDAGIYLDQHAKKGETIGLAVKPNFSFPTLKNNPSEYYDAKKQYDYVVVSYFVVLREGFDDSMIKQTYKPMHTIYADKAPIVVVYKKK